MNALGRQFANLQAKMEMQKENSQKSAKEVIESTKEEIIRLKEQSRNQLDNNHSHVSIQLLRAQFGFILREHEIKTRISARQNKSEKQRIKSEAEEYAEFAAFTMSHAILAIDEAILAFYEAIEKLENYDEKYNTKRRQLIDE